MWRNEHVFAFNTDKAFEKNLKYYNNEKIAIQLFNEGLNWFNTGKKIDEATDIVFVNGKEIQKRNQINFQRGYQEGEKRLGFEYGYKNTNLLNIPLEYQENKFFLNGYREGFLAWKKEEKKSTNSRHK